MSKQNTPRTQIRDLDRKLTQQELKALKGGFGPSGPAPMSAGISSRPGRPPFVF